MTLREKILTEFQSWDSEKQLHEFQSYKQLDGYSPFNTTDYSLMEQIMNNANASIDCEDGNCEISYEKPKEEKIEPKKPEVITESEKETKTKDAKSIWDRKNGIGAVSNQLPSDVAYFGFEATMKASEFLILAANQENKDLTYVEKHFKEGGTFGLPFLGIDWYGDEEGSRKENKWKVDKHEGRHRVEFFIKEFGDQDITVSMFTSRYTGELRNRNLKPEMFAKGIKLEPQTGSKHEGKKYEIADLAQSKFFDFKLGQTIKEEDISEGIKENKKLKELTTEINNILKEINTEAKTTTKMSDEEKLQVVYKMMRQLKEIPGIVSEIDDFLNMDF